MKRPVCVIVGVGQGNGSAFAHRFVKEGYTVALLARGKKITEKLVGELEHACAYECDVSDVNSIKTVFSEIKHDLGDIDTLIYNAGAAVWGDLEEVTLELFESAWRINSMGLFAAAQAVAPAMKEKQRGNIIIIGATSSRRGAVKTIAFASAKAAQRSLTESMAKYLWPFGIHVALVIIDGIVDLVTTRKMMPDKPQEFFVSPEAVADTVFMLTQQSSSAWSFEVEARPFKENW